MTGHDTKACGCEVDALPCGCERGCVDGEMCETASELWERWMEDHLRIDHEPIDHYKHWPRSYRLATAAWDAHWEVTA